MTSIPRYPVLVAIVGLALVTVTGVGCGGSAAEKGPAGDHGHAGGDARSQGGGRPGGGPGESSTAVPVEVAAVERRSISFYIQTNGTLEAENEVDLVARTNGPIEELRTEEGQMVSKGQLLARIEDDEIRARTEIARVALDEARLNFERAEHLHGIQLLSPEEYEQTKSRFDTAEAQHRGNRLELAYTEIRAPFSGQIVARYVDAAEQVTPGKALFRLSDFDPLLCPVQVPERELRRLALGQAAYLSVEAWPDRRFDAKVLRISPVVDAGSGTVKVTLDVEAQGKLRPGMFARVYLKTETHDDAIVIPKTALSLESLGDSVFVYRDGSAARREVEIGYEEGDMIEVLSGVSPGDLVVVVGQDGLSDGTPIQVLGGMPSDESGVAAVAAVAGEATAEEMLENARSRMREVGMSEDAIEKKIERLRERAEAIAQRANQAGQDNETAPAERDSNP